MSDDLVKSHIEWLRGDHELCNPFLADRIEALEARAEKAEAERDALRAAINRAGALACQRASHAFIIDALKEADT